MAETRKLAAIVCSDVVGYSRLADADEDRILTRLRALPSDLIDPTIAVHHGRIVKRTGDGAIVNIVDAVRLAIEVQNALVERNAKGSMCRLTTRMRIRSLPRSQGCWRRITPLRRIRAPSGLSSLRKRATLACVGRRHGSIVGCAIPPLQSIDANILAPARIILAPAG